MDEQQMAAAFNEWMRRFIANPDEFNREFESVQEFISEGEAPTYGAVCAAFMLKIHAELTAN